MASKRPRQRGAKNKPATMQEIIDTVGRLMKTQGHGGLKVNNIAKYSGRNRSLINRYFGSLDGLQRAYIMETDYWVPFLERFALTDADGLEEVQAVFTELMQESLRNFKASPDVQKLILWQISEVNALMTEVSYGRERKGEPLFTVTDRCFDGTDVSFRTVIAVLLGGIYYLTLHAESNKSTVCGIDINREHDREVLLKTLGQIIYWSCAATNEQENNLQSIPMMYNQFELLDRIAAELSERESTALTANSLLVTECAKLKRGIPNHVLTLKNDTQIRSYLKMVVTKLGEVLEEVYNAEASQNPDAHVLVDLLKVVLRHYFDVLPLETVMPKMYCVQEGLVFNKAWLRVKLRLEELEIDASLISLVHFPFGRLNLSHVEVTAYDLKYLKLYASVLELECMESVTDEDSLMEVLIGLGFNFSRFNSYYTLRLKHRLKGVEQVEKASVLESAYVWVGQVLSRTPLVFDQNRQGLGEDLQKWINAELHKGLGMSSVSEEGIFDNSMDTNLTTSELSAWQKLQYDAGVYVESNMDVFSGKVAYNFKTKRGSRPSGKSVKSKMYSKELETYKVLRPLVNKMKEEIDRFLM